MHRNVAHSVLFSINSFDTFETDYIELLPGSNYRMFLKGDFSSRKYNECEIIKTDENIEQLLEIGNIEDNHTTDILDCIGFLIEI